MKYINKILASAIIAATGVSLTGCFGDLDTMPLDDNQVVSGQVYNTVDGYMGMLAKCYAALILSGQQGGDGGDPDVQNADGGYQSYIRLMFYLEELCTDNFLMPSTSNGLRQCLSLQWNANNASVATWTWQRLFTVIAYCNEFLRECTEDKLHDRGLWNELGKDCNTYRAEVRMIRAYCYEVLLDLYANVPIIDETVGPKDIPAQRTRQEVFDYAISELKSILGETGDGSEVLADAGTAPYAHVDKAAAWFLLARMYLNSEAWLGQNNYANALTYAEQVIKSNAYPLASDYRHIFLADNNTCSEIIWPLVADGQNSQGSGGTNFYVKAFVNGPMNGFYNTGVGERGWGNVRSKTTLWGKFDPADVPFDVTDTWGDNKMDKRAQFMTVLDGQVGETWDENGDFSTLFAYGYSYIKWRNVTKADQICASGEAFTSIDFPLMRTADAYLMAAEAILRGGGSNRAQALEYVNKIRQRAYMSGEFAVAGVRSDVAGTITDAELDLDFILAERSRELASEIIRRTDLIRFGKFTKGFNWDWKNFVREGTDVSDHLMLFAIPEAEMTNNPTLKQNPGF